MTTGIINPLDRPSLGLKVLDRPRCPECVDFQHNLSRQLHTGYRRTHQGECHPTNHSGLRPQINLQIDRAGEGTKKCDFRANCARHRQPSPGFSYRHVDLHESNEIDHTANAELGLHDGADIQLSPGRLLGIAGSIDSRRAPEDFNHRRLAFVEKWCKALRHLEIDVLEGRVEHHRHRSRGAEEIPHVGQAYISGLADLQEPRNTSTLGEFLYLVFTIRAGGECKSRIASIGRTHPDSSVLHRDLVDGGIPRSHVGDQVGHQLIDDCETILHPRFPDRDRRFS